MKDKGTFTINPTYIFVYISNPTYIFVYIKSVLKLQVGIHIYIY